jgi:hypothetical protein
MLPTHKHTYTVLKIVPYWKCHDHYQLRMKNQHECNINCQHHNTTSKCNDFFQHHLHTDSKLDNFLIVPVDMASNNIVFVCKKNTIMNAF